VNDQPISRTASASTARDEDPPRAPAGSGRTKSGSGACSDPASAPARTVRPADDVRLHRLALEAAEQLERHLDVLEDPERSRKHSGMPDAPGFRARCQLGEEVCSTPRR